MPRKSDALARAISIAGHPFVTATVLMLASARAAWGVTFMLIAIVPVAALMFVQVRRGAWEHVDASNRGERKTLYLVGIAAVLAALAYLVVTQPRSPMTRGVAITAATLLVLAILTRWVKVSLHVFFAALAATTLLDVRPPAGWALAAFVPPLIWSRLHLRRHTPLEVTLGLVAGIVAGLLI